MHEKLELIQTNDRINARYAQCICSPKITISIVTCTVIQGTQVMQSGIAMNL